MSFPIKHGDSNHSYVHVYQRVPKLRRVITSGGGLELARQRDGSWSKRSSDKDHLNYIIIYKSVKYVLNKNFHQLQSIIFPSSFHMFPYIFSSFSMVFILTTFHSPDAPCMQYLSTFTVYRLPQKWGSFVAKYSSTMVRIGGRSGHPFTSAGRGGRLPGWAAVHTFGRVPGCLERLQRAARCAAQGTPAGAGPLGSDSWHSRNMMKHVLFRGVDGVSWDYSWNLSGLSGEWKRKMNWLQCLYTFWILLKSNIVSAK